jgi:uncharacterized protein (PEP-CTERM system associated)
VSLPSRSRLARAAAALVWGGALPLGSATAQTSFEPPVATAVSKVSPPSAAFEVQSTLTATDNGSLAVRGQERSDLIASVRPQLRVSRRGPAVTFELDAAATLLGYANGTQQGGVLPDVRAALKSMVVERWFYVDAQAQVRQSEADPFGTRTDLSSGANGRTRGRYRLSPYLEREFLPNTTLLARHDLGITTNAAGDATRLLTNQTLVRVERKPLPLGAAVELSHFTSETNGAANDRFTLDTGRVRGNLALNEDIVVGVIAGQDRSKFLLSNYTDTLYGAAFHWRPGPRTDFSVELEHRFFGQSGAIEVRHRTPSMSFSFRAGRQPVVASSELGVLGPDIRNFLDAILTTRYPDHDARVGVVDDVVATRALDTRTAQAIDVAAKYPQLVTSLQGSWAWLNARNAASLILYSQTTRRLSRDGDPFESSVASVADSRQYGGSVQFNRRLAPQLSTTLLARWSRVKGLAARSGDLSDDKSVRVSFQQELSPRTGVSAGIQHTRFKTTVDGQNSYDATLAFVGMSHRF